MTERQPADTPTLLAESLRAWNVAGRVECAGDGIVVASDAAELQITRAPAELPFRWMIATGGRTRGVLGIAGLLRAVRGALDPAFRPVRIRIGLPPS